MKKIRHKQNKGITLVALVITIIVLIILAAVSINAVMNDGLIENAKTTAENYKEKAQIEAIQLALTAEELRITMEGGNADRNRIKADLEETYGEGKVTIEQLKGTFSGTTYTLEDEFILKIDDKKYRIYGDSNVTEWEYDGNITFDFDGSTCTIFNGATWDDVCKFGVKLESESINGDYFIHNCKDPNNYYIESWGNAAYFATYSPVTCTSNSGCGSWESPGYAILGELGFVQSGDMIINGMSYNWSC